MLQNRLFITGIPTSGKSYLAEKIAFAVDGIRVSVDEIRYDLRNDKRFEQWSNFYWHKDERGYYITTAPEQQWENLVRQSEGLWPGILEKIKQFEAEKKVAIFEGVNILPHLAARDFSFPGIVLIGKSFKAVLERNMKEPRWGKTEDLQKLEATSFFYAERPHYKEEALRYGYKVFETADDAYRYTLGLLK